MCRVYHARAMKFRALSLLALALLPAMGLWFGVSAVAPQIAKEWHLDEGTTAWLTLSVQLGFVTGTLFSALFNLADVIRPRHLFALSAFLGAVANALLAWQGHSVPPAPLPPLIPRPRPAGGHP